MGLYDREYYREPEGQMSFNMSGQSATMLLVYANVGIFLIDWVFQLELINTFGVHADTLYEPKLWYQFLTYGFLHYTKTVWHILMNMFVLWMFGRFVEDRYGKAEFLKIYFISIVFCGLVWNLVTLAEFNFKVPTTVYEMVGASGAISTIMTLFICLYPKMTLYLGMIFPVPAWVAGVIILLLNLFGQDEQVAYSAHLAGIGLGLAYFFSGINLGRIIPSKISLPKWSLRSRPRLRVHTEEDEYDPYNDSDEEAERILDKVRESGMGSLSETERRKLEAYSRRMRQKLS
ncbi:rhomboid family intramembrane serine protease [Bremerella cremea]|uniref:Rhomboid family intramembrane serine protease n=1 Tax=Bremerella cremea TaxID=1031537 RepID=A0A368KPW3_9BACT|nr:rhomboid family intramembrane serine protease [Bremerella cremea]RCS47689.1 rhomboid family intramembrane serine protease [Bremerella cremea]